MDESNETISVNSLIPSPTPTTTADLENDPGNEIVSTMDSSDILLGTNPQNNYASGTEDEQPNQQRINDSGDTDLVMDLGTDDVSDKTLVENDTGVDEISDTEPNTDDTLNDTEPNTDDTLNDSNPNASITETNKEIKSDQKTEKISQFPLGRVRDIMKADPDIKIVSAECVFLVAKATEMFLQRLGREIHAITLRNKKKTLQKKDLNAVISENVAFEFLDGALN